ncbi:hypothetical protein [Algibacter sp. PT7-4]|uniref:hypothetical protein n=1 Tax=Algibacter ulvanivorans TaxID=3400999 RepID=UPI003AAE1755
MRYLLLFFLIISVVSCKAKAQPVLTTANKVENNLCPKTGACLYQMLKDKALYIKKDNFGSVYPELINGNQLVLKFEYKKQNKSSLQDSSYREEVFIALDKNNLEFKTSNLEDKTIYFARWCYCKGQTGYYKINKGELAIVKLSNKKFNLHLSFVVKEVPQVINEINFTFNID